MSLGGMAWMETRKQQALGLAQEIGYYNQGYYFIIYYDGRRSRKWLNGPPKGGEAASISSPSGVSLRACLHMAWLTSVKGFLDR